MHPNQKAVIASGFSETDRVKESQELGAGEYIKKPYTIEKFSLAIKSALAQDRAAKFKESGAGGPTFDFTG
jgi:DNA-binding NtrC family response regulator